MCVWKGGARFTSKHGTLLRLPRFESEVSVSTDLISWPQKPILYAHLLFTPASPSFVLDDQLMQLEKTIGNSHCNLDMRSTSSSLFSIRLSFLPLFLSLSPLPFCGFVCVFVFLSLYSFLLSLSDTVIHLRGFVGWFGRWLIAGNLSVKWFTIQWSEIS